MMTTFQHFMPAGWYRLDLTEEVAPQVAELAALLTEGAPVDRRRAARETVTRRLLPSVEEFARGDALSVLMTTDATDPLRPTIVFMPFRAPEEVDPMDLLVGLATQEPTAELIDLPDLVALRMTSEKDVTEDAEATIRSEVLDPLLGAEVAQAAAPGEADLRVVSRQVRHVIGNPSDRDQWLDVYFALTHLDLPEIRETADAAIELGDVLVRTVRWNHG